MSVDNLISVSRKSGYTIVDNLSAGVLADFQHICLCYGLFQKSKRSQKRRGRMYHHLLCGNNIKNERMCSESRSQNWRFRGSILGNANSNDVWSPLVIRKVERASPIAESIWMLLCSSLTTPNPYKTNKTKFQVWVQTYGHVYFTHHGAFFIISRRHTIRRIDCIMQLPNENFQINSWQYSAN